MRTNLVSKNNGPNLFSHRLTLTGMALLLIAVATTPLIAAESEPFNWQEASGALDSLPFSHRYKDSIYQAFSIKYPSPSLRSLGDQSFTSGETLVYDIGWGLFKAGYVLLTATPDTAHHAIRLGGKAISRGFVSTFYRTRDYMLSTIDARGFYPIFFEQHLREGKHFKADHWTLFDHEHDSVYIHEGKLKTLPIPKFTNDFLSIFYYIRSLSFSPGDTFSLPICVDKKVRTINFTCTIHDTVEAVGRIIPCLVIQPRISSDNGAFNRKSSLEVWVSDDSRKIPVKIKSKISLGSITAKLIYDSGPLVRPGTTGSPAKISRRDSARMPVDSPVSGESAKKTGTGLGRDSMKSGDSNAPLLGYKRDSTPLKDLPGQIDSTINKHPVKDDGEGDGNVQHRAAPVTDTGTGSLRLSRMDGNGTPVADIFGPVPVPPH